MSDKPKVLLVDDNEAFLELFPNLEGARGLDITPLSSGQQALQILRTQPVDLILSDVRMPGMSGIELFNKVQDISPETPMILITAYGSTQEAIEAVKRGAFHYFEKPIDNKLDLIWATVREALAKRQMLKELATLRKERSLQIRDPVTIIGQSEGIKTVVGAIKEVAGLGVTVLIRGETGTGKELVARAIHQYSERRSKPFFAVNCNEFAPGVLESELFGHEKGAFTGAFERKIGLFDVVHRGVLFLDEISEAPPFFQSKLLRVVETKTFMRVGGITPIYSDFRLLVATNRNLESEIVAGRFREDLYYRLNVYTIQIPPLRERKEDVPLLASFYLQRFSEAYRRPVREISADAMILLRDYEWPGNVRELINVIERGVITCPGPVITTAQLPFGVKQYQGASDLNLRDAEKLFIELALKRTQSNKTRAAELLGISRKTLGEKLKAYEMNDDCEM